MVRFSLKLSIFLLLSALIGYGVYLLDPVFVQSDNPWLLVANLLPALCVFVLWWGLTRRLLLGFLLTAGFIALLFVVNHNKLLHLGEPLIFSDVYLLPQIVSGWRLTHQYANIPMLVVGLVFALAVFYFLWRYEKPSLRWGVNLLILCVGAGGLVFIVIGKQGVQSLYASLSSNTSPWNFASVAENKGLLSSLVTGARLTSLTRPSFDAHLIDQFVAAQGLRPERGMAELKPDIILWLSESFFDTQVVNSVEPCHTWPLFCELQSQGLTAQMQVSTYAGNTTRTEFEVLTGVPFKFLVGQDYPYISAVNSYTHSLAWALQNQGYKTIAVHPHNRIYWQRHRALPLLGFQAFEGEETFRGAKRSGYYIADKYLTERTKAHLTAAADPTFLLAISMENHGPWGTGTRGNMDKERLAAITAPDGLSDEAALAWREYAYHGETAMQALAELYAFAQERERPTLIVFFGDHLPGLGEVFEQLGFKNGQSAPHQKLPVIALANYPLSADWTPAFAHDLGVWTLHLADQLNDQYFAEMNAALAQLRKPSVELVPLVEQALASMQARVLATQAQVDLAAIAAFDTAKAKAQPVKPKATKPQTFCALGEWGPQETQAGVAANELPDGSMGVWMHTACFPERAGLFLGDARLQIVRADFGLTTSIPLELLASAGAKPLYFFDEDSGEKRLVGHIQVRE